MKILVENQHYNGFKIYLATKVIGKNISFTSGNGVPGGAVLQVIDGPSLVKYSLNANSAVFYLLKNSNFVVQKYDETWLEWESGDYQVCLQSFFHSVYTKKEDNGFTSKLFDSLSLLEKSIADPPFISETSASSIVIFSSLCVVASEKKFLSMLESQFPSIFTFYNKLQNNSIYKECLRTWYGTDGIPIRKWLHMSFVASSENDAFNLLGSSSTHSKNSNSQDFEDKTLASIDDAKKGWSSDFQKSLPPRQQSHPILPCDGKKNILVSSALPYVNNVPHLGNIIGCVLSADCFVRYCRINGDNVLFICGTDEYGTATEAKALEEGLTPQQICDKYNEIHTSIYKWFDISFDHFGRTTTEHQTKIAQEIFWDLEKNGKITKNSIEQLYCLSCKKFLADRFVEGTCPHPGCGYEEARGDQCDSCSKLVNATELKNSKCKVCSSPPEIRVSDHLFLDLPQIEADLKTWVDKSSQNWTHNAKVICSSWIRDGLKPRCITRDLKWGTPVPLPGYTDKVFYVWYDAPIGYISITMEYTDQWEKWWKKPSKILYYQFMAKDNVPFHSVIFPACQIATKKEWTKVTHIIATEYLNYEAGKFSKSRGIGVFGDEAKNTGIPSDVWRFYLLYTRPEGHDTAFSWEDLQTKNNNELLNNLGNFINRGLKFVYQVYNKHVPFAKPKEVDFKMMAAVNLELATYQNALSSSKLRDGICHVLAISRIGNQYLQDNEPFKLVKSENSSDKERAGTVISVAINVIALLSVILEPYIPQISQKIKEFLGCPASLYNLPKCFTQLIPDDHKINEPYPLVRKITDEEVDKLKLTFAGKANPCTATTEESKMKSEPVTNNISNMQKDVLQLTSLVQEQGIKVRQLKTNGADKSIISGEVSILLDLKNKLSLAQGIEPESLCMKKSSKKKK